MKKITCTHKIDKVSFIIYLNENKFYHLAALHRDELLKKIAVALAAKKFTGAELHPGYYISKVRKTENPAQYSLSYASNDNVERYDNNCKIDLTDPKNADFDVKLEEADVAEIYADEILLTRITDQGRCETERDPVNDDTVKPVYEEKPLTAQHCQDIKIFSDVDWQPYYKRLQDSAESYKNQQLVSIKHDVAVIKDEIGSIRCDAYTKTSADTPQDLANFVNDEINLLNLDLLYQTITDIETAEKARCDQARVDYLNNYKAAHRPLTYFTQLLAWHLYVAAQKYWAQCQGGEKGNQNKKRASFKQKFNCVGIQLTDADQLTNIQGIYNEFDETQLYKTALAYNRRPGHNEFELNKLYLYYADGSLEYAVKHLGIKTIYRTQLTYGKKPADHEIEDYTVYLYLINGSLEYAVKNRNGEVETCEIKPDELGEHNIGIRKVLSDPHKKQELGEKQKKALESLYGEHYVYYPNTIARKKITPQELGEQYDAIKNILSNPEKQLALDEKQKEAFQKLTARHGYYQRILDKTQALIQQLLNHVDRSPWANALRCVRDELHAFNVECHNSPIFNKRFGKCEGPLFNLSFFTMFGQNFTWNENASQLEKQIRKESDAMLTQPYHIDTDDTDLVRARATLTDVKSRLFGSTTTRSLREKIAARKEKLIKLTASELAAAIPVRNTEEVTAALPSSPDPAITACIRLVKIISDLNYWHDKITWHGGDEVRLGGRELRVPKGIALMIEMIKLYHAYETDAGQATFLLNSFKTIAIDSRKRSQHNFIKYSIFNIRNPRLDRFYDCLRGTVNGDLMVEIRKWEDHCGQGLRSSVF